MVLDKGTNDCWEDMAFRVGAGTATPAQPSAAKRSRVQDLVHQYNVAAPFERTAISTRATTRTDSVLDHITKWSEANHDPSEVEEAMVTTFLCCL